jgi:hypothetical protein
MNLSLSVIAMMILCLGGLVAPFEVLRYFVLERKP